MTTRRWFLGGLGALVAVAAAPALAVPRLAKDPSVIGELVVLTEETARGYGGYAMRWLVVREGRYVYAMVLIEDRSADTLAHARVALRDHVNLFFKLQEKELS